MTPRDGSSARPSALTASGIQSAAVWDNSGIVQTGDRARAFQGPPVPLGRPQDVPAPVPALIGLPKRPVKTFVGRDHELAQLGLLISAGTGVVAQAQTVHGLGGVGKTELALQYAYKHRDKYPMLWWVTADSPEAVVAGLAQLTYRLHPDVQLVATEDEAANWAWGWLQSHPGWLLVLDNVERREDVDALLGQLTGGHVLITTRRDLGWEEFTDGCLWVQVLTAEAAVALLLQLSAQDDANTAAVLAEELGYLPLALQQAGAYVRRTQVSIKSYLQRLRDDPGRMLAAVAAGGLGERAVAKVWSVTLAQVSSESPTAVALINVLSCLAPDDLPRDVLTTVDSDTARVDEELGVLASYNMITLTRTTVTVHRLVQATIVAQLSSSSDRKGGEEHETTRRYPQPWYDVIRIALACLIAAVPSGDPASTTAAWPRWASINKHIDALSRNCSDEVGGTDLANLLGECAEFEFSQGSYQAALGMQVRALRIDERKRGPDHPTVAQRLGNVASSLLFLGRSVEAEPLQRRALAISEATLGPESSEVAIQLDKLANILKDLGRADEAEPLQRRALAISEATLGPEDPEVATNLNNLASTLRRLGRPSEAETLQRRAVALGEAVLGADHPTVSIRLNNLASILQDQGRVAEAEPLQRRASAAIEAALGPEHPEVATALNNLALNLQRFLGRPAEAEQLQRRVLAILEATLGVDHPYFAGGLANLARTCVT